MEHKNGCNEEAGLRTTGMVGKPPSPEQAARAMVEATFDRIEETTRQIVMMEARERMLRQELREAHGKCARLDQRLDELARELAQVRAYLEEKELLPTGLARPGMGALQAVQLAFEGNDGAAILAVHAANKAAQRKRARARRA